MKTSPKRWRWRMTSAIPRSVTPASGALDACLKAYGGFDHNAQTLRVVTPRWSTAIPISTGLNLTWESLEGIVKHNGPLTERNGAPVGRCREHGIPVGISTTTGRMIWSCGASPSLEAQVAAIADDIAYDAHDIDDGLRAGLFAVDDLKVMPLTRRNHRGNRAPLFRPRRRQARRPNW